MQSAGAVPATWHSLWLVDSGKKNSSCKRYVKDSKEPKINLKRRSHPGGWQSRLLLAEGKYA